MQYLEDFITALQHLDVRTKALRTYWQKPKHGFVKVNFDGAMNVAEGMGGSGVIIRDEEGIVLGACSLVHLGLQEPEIIEASAAFFQKMIVEGDAARVISLLRKSGEDFSSIGNLIKDYRSLCCNFQIVEMSHVKREANQDADCLAKYALNSKINSYWVEEYPSVLNNSIAPDCTNL
ncbi:hypothetical protein REPUB_Repub08aG0035500 [Reevesia pubescens]